MQRHGGSDYEAEYSAGMLFYCPDDQTVLLLKRSGIMSHPNVWSIPGGRADEDDTSVLDTAVREASEELDDLPNKKKLIAKHIMNTKPKYKYHVFVYAIPVNEKKDWTPNIELDKENSRLRWFKLNEIPHDTHFDLSWIPDALGKQVKTASIKKFASEIIKPRHELKYYLPMNLAEDIRNFAKPYLVADTHGQFYSIKNIYLDNDNYRFFTDHIYKPDRFKLRIRTYSNDQDEFFFEIKRKANGTISKYRTIVPSDSYYTVVAEQDISIPFIKIAYQYKAKPNVLISYDREAYNAVDSSARLTFDTNIHYARHCGYDFDDDAKASILPEDIGILELKYNGNQMPTFMKEIKRAFDLERHAISKYCMSISNLLSKDK